MTTERTPISTVKEHIGTQLTVPQVAEVTSDMLRSIIGNLANKRGKFLSNDRDNLEEQYTHNDAVMQCLGMFHVKDFWASYTRSPDCSPSVRMAYEFSQQLDELIGLNNEAVPLTCPKNGRIVRRIANAIYKVLDWKLDEEDKRRLSSAIQSATSPHLDAFDFTKDFQWRAGDFGDYGSCFWSCHSAARFTMEQEPGFYAMRSYDKINGDGNGRCWMYATDREFVLFNAYGPTLMRFASTLRAWYQQYSDYFVNQKEISLINRGEVSGDLYINHGVARLVSDSELILNTWSNAKAYDLDVYVDHALALPVCPMCDDEFEQEYGYTDPNGDLICEHCWNETYTYCERCQETTNVNEIVYVYALGYRGRREEQAWCEYCASHDAEECDVSGEYWDSRDMHSLYGGGSVSPAQTDQVLECEACSIYMRDEDANTIPDSDEPYVFCPDCIGEAIDQHQREMETTNE